jgi:hypothetical protein
MIIVAGCESGEETETSQALVARYCVRIMSKDCGETDGDGVWKNGRDDWIRTSDLTHPKRARYQAALRPDRSKTTPLRRRQGESKAL